MNGKIVNERKAVFCLRIIPFASSLEIWPYLVCSEESFSSSPSSLNFSTAMCENLFNFLITEDFI